MKVYPHLWFESQAEEVMAFYTSVFRDSKVLGRTELSIVRFELAGLPIAALNAHMQAPYIEAFSFLVETDDQAETDYYCPQAFLLGQILILPTVWSCSDRSGAAVRAGMRRPDVSGLAYHFC